MENKKCENCLNYNKDDIYNSVICKTCFDKCNYICTSDYEINDKNNEIITKEDESIKPTYYSNSDIDVIEFCNLNNIEFWCGNVIKYCVRSGKKSKEKEIEDLKKAIEYINRRIDFINRK